MSLKPLAIKYRPKTFEDVVEQNTTVRILKNQIQNNDFKSAMLFVGPAGTGKTTLAKIVASEINGTVLEIDAATHNGVSDIKDIINESKVQTLIGDYKVIIFDEAHCLTPQAWSSFLITLEEPPAKTVFIFCTTNPEKIPDTILSRVQRFNLTRISEQAIVDRLKYILDLENKNGNSCSYDEEALKFIARKAEGGLRDSLTYLDKCILYSNQITLETVQASLDIVSFETLFNLHDAIYNKDTSTINSIINNLYDNGYNLVLTIEDFIELTMNCILYISLQNEREYINIPSSYYNRITTSYLEFYNKLLDTLMELKYNLKQDSNPKVTILACLYLFSNDWSN